MATTAEINALDPDNAVHAPRARQPRYRPFRLGSRGSSGSNVLQFHPQTFEGAFHEEYVSSSSIPAGSDQATRLLNTAVAAIGLIIAAPVMILIAVLVKVTSRGPIFYEQIRIGLDRRWNRTPTHDDIRIQDLGGRPFTMHKFRTMVTTAESDRREVWAKPGDERVTLLGRYLRATRLDELPQLLNVLAGDMNVVGPRPERPSIFAELRKSIPDYHLRQRVMPGITGWAQINQSYDTCVDDVRRKVEFDLEYLRTRSVARDLSIMARTLPVMVMCDLGW